MIIDTHAHYDDEKFDADRREVIEGLKEQGVVRAVNVAASIPSIDQTLKLIETYPNLYGAVGVHPTELEGMDEAVIEKIVTAAKHPKVVAIGEIGLDYYWKPVDSAGQKYWFKRQIEVAGSVGLPLIIHSREAAKDTFDIMQAAHAEEIGGVIHCYSYSVEMAREYVKMGFYLGIGGVVTFSNSKTLKEVVVDTDISRLVLETDSPYLAPVPNRGKRNDSANLRYVAEKIAELKGMSREEVERITEENAHRLYPKLA